MAPAQGDWSKWCLFLLCVAALLCDCMKCVSLCRDELLNIRIDVLRSGYKPAFLQTLDSSIPTDPANFESADVPRRAPKRKRGKRAGALVRLRQRAYRPPLPAVMLANVRSLANKKDEFLLLTNYNRDFKDCSAFCFTETWLNPNIPDSAMLQPPGFSLHRADRNPDLCHKSRGGGVCFMVNQRWCTDVTVLSSYCSPDLESIIVKCRPFYSPREVPTVTMFGVYIPPSANGINALNQLADQITSVENNNPDTTVLIFGDFNNTNLRKCYQNMNSM